MNIPNDRCYRALLFDEEEEYEEFIAALSGNIAADGDDPVTLNNRGVARFELGDFTGALDDLTAACRMITSDSIPFLNRADVLEKTGDLQEAIDSAAEGIRVEPEEAMGYEERAKSDEQAGKRLKI